MSTQPSPRWRRAVGGLFPLWTWIFLAAVIAGFVPGVPYAIAGPLVLVSFLLMLVRPGRQDDREPVEVASPVRGRWTVVHSPASKVPSHGVRAYGQSHAVDIIHPRPHGTTPSYPLVGGFERPERFSSFGEPIHAVADGVVVQVVDRARDHLSRTSWLAFLYMMVVEGFRDLGGPRAVIGNHVVIDHGGDVYSLYAHVRRGSATVSVGERVTEGSVLGQVGNSGNTSEPHLHFQLMDHPKSVKTAGLPFVIRGLTQREGEVDRGWTKAEPDATITPGMPANCQVFEA